MNLAKPGAGAHTERAGPFGRRPGPRKTPEQIEPRRLLLLQQGSFLSSLIKGKERGHR